MASDRGSSESFRNILLQVTIEKLDELKRQKNLMKSHFLPVIEAVKSENFANLQLLYEAIRDSPVEMFNRSITQNLKYLLQNAKEDPSISPQIISVWIDKLKAEIDFSLRKCDYSYLYGSLLSERLEVEGRRSVIDKKSEEEKSRAAREKHIADLQGIIFSPPDFDRVAFNEFLESELFDFSDNPGHNEILSEIRNESNNFFKPQTHEISTSSVKSCISGLLSEDLLSFEKKAALKELKENSPALKEVASLLTNRLRNIGCWSWPEYVLMDVRRGMAGQYRAFLDEDLMTSLLLQYTGVKWAVYFKRQFLEIYKFRIWKRPEEYNLRSIESFRQTCHQRAFLSVLPDSMDLQVNANNDEYVKDVQEYADEQDDDMGFRLFDEDFDDGIVQDLGGGVYLEEHTRSSSSTSSSSSSRSRSRSSSSCSSSSTCSSSSRERKRNGTNSVDSSKMPTIELKQTFLHYLSTEVHLNQVARPEVPLIVVQADLDPYSPGVKHESILAVLKFFGVSQVWLDFFATYLRNPVRFKPDENTEIRVRGFPVSHVLSTLFGEALLFLLDLHVNQITGLNMYRVFDEFWFWGNDSSKISKAWEMMERFAGMTGMTLNRGTSGSTATHAVEMPDRGQIYGPTPLPQKGVRWGYLELRSNGVLTIDLSSIVSYMEEMRALFDKAECVLEWVNIYNKYMAFFIRNFGKCAVVFGSQHLSQITHALRKIHLELFKDTEGNPTESLKAKYTVLKQLQVVDAWVYWPLERGGLGLVNPFIEVLSLKETYDEVKDNKAFTLLPLEDKIKWKELKMQIKRENDNRPKRSKKNVPTLEEYIAKRETELEHWYERYIEMLERLKPKMPRLPAEYWKIELPDNHKNHHLKWVYAYYNVQLVQHFGSLQFIRTSLTYEYD